MKNSVNLSYTMVLLKGKEIRSLSHIIFNLLKKEVPGGILILLHRTFFFEVIEKKNLYKMACGLLIAQLGKLIILHSRIAKGLSC